MSDTGTTTTTRSGLDPQVMRIATAVIVGGIAVILDSTIVSVALDQLGHKLHTSVSTIQWVSTGYLLAMFVAIPATGWLQSRLGGKRLWLLALAAFLFGSVLCAFAWNPASLIVFRVVQGLGGGVMMPLMTTLIIQAARGQSLGRLMAVIGLPISLGPILGPVIGGIILNWLSWQWLFLVNVPICAVGAVLAWRILPNDRPAPDTPRRSFDALGFLLLTPGTVGIVYGLTNITKDGGLGRTDVLVPVLAGLVLVVGFAAWAFPRGDRALVDIHLFKHRPLTTGAVLLFLTGVSLYGAMLLLPLFWQQLRDYGPLGAGLLLIPQGLGNLASRNIGGRLTDEIGPKWVAFAGFAVVTVATIPFALMHAHTAVWWLLVALFIRGFGLGLVMTPLMSVSYLGLEHAEIPHASTITRVMQQLGGSFGTAVLAVILEHAVAGAHDHDTLAHGFDQAFWWAVGFTAAAALLTLTLPGRPAVKEPAA